MQLSKGTMLLTTGKDSSVIATAKPYEDKATGTIYVSVRFTAQAFGFSVAWDKESDSVTVQSVDDIIAESGATYAVMDQYLTFQKSFAAGRHALQGGLQFDMNLPVDSSKSTKLTASGTLSGLQQGNDSELTLALQSNASDLKKIIGSDSDTDPWISLLLAVLDDVETKVLVNSKDGNVYIKTPLSITLHDQQSPIWISMETKSLMSGSNLTTVAAGTSGPASYRDYVLATLKKFCLSDSGRSGTTAKKKLSQLNALYSDQAMTASGSTYTSTVTSVTTSGSVTNTDVTKLTITVNASGFQSLKLEESQDEKGIGIITQSYTTDSAGNFSFRMSENMKSSLTMDLSASYTCTETADSPTVTPPKGCTVLPFSSTSAADLEDLIS